MFFVTFVQNIFFNSQIFQLSRICISLIRKLPLLLKMFSTRRKFWVPKSVTKWWNESSRIFPKVAQQEATAVFTWVVMYFEMASQKTSSPIWATYVWNVFTKTFKMAQSGHSGPRIYLNIFVRHSFLENQFEDDQKFFFTF